MLVMTKAELLAATEAKFEVLDVPELGGKVGVRRVSGVDRGNTDSWATKLREAKKFWQLKALCVAASLCDDQGAPILISSAEVEQLATNIPVAIERIWEKSNELNLWIFVPEKVEKNSEASQS